MPLFNPAGTVPGNLSVTGNSAVTGNATVGGTLGVTGTSTLGATGTGALTVAGAATVSTTLGVTGVSTLTGLANLNGGTTTAASAPALTPTFANGTAAQLTDTTRDYMVYLQIGTAGTAFSLAIGPTSGVANTIMASATPLSDELLSVRLPAGWFLKWAGTATTLTNQTAIGC